MRRYDTGLTDRQMRDKNLNKRLRANEPVHQCHQPFTQPQAGHENLTEKEQREQAGRAAMGHLKGLFA